MTPWRRGTHATEQEGLVGAPQVSTLLIDPMGDCAAPVQCGHPRACRDRDAGQPGWHHPRGRNTGAKRVGGHSISGPSWWPTRLFARAPGPNGTCHVSKCCTPPRCPRLCARRPPYQVST